MAGIDYRYEFRRGDEVVATGHLNYEQPLAVGDPIEIGGQPGIVRTIEPLLRELEEVAIASRHVPVTENTINQKARPVLRRSPRFFGSLIKGGVAGPRVTTRPSSRGCPSSGCQGWS